MIWTSRQRAVLSVITAALLVFLGVRYAMNRAYIPDPQPVEGSRASELPDRIDPNTADWPTLAALPVIGKVLAQRIVEEREAFRAANPGRPPYEKLEDLRRVRGIGPATLRALEPYLVLPQQDSRPAPP